MLLHSVFADGLTLEGFLLCALLSLLLGLSTSLTYRYRSRTSASMAMTLVLLPLSVQTVIFLVNGNLGVGVAVAGAFSLVRFRSVPGSAREISAIFIAMAIGLATGTGYLLVAALFALTAGGTILVLTMFSYGLSNDGQQELKITIPETLDFDHLFDDLLAQYTTQSELVLTRTTNLGSLYELTYLVNLKPDTSIQLFLDALRTLNGNLNIRLGRNPSMKEEL